MRPLPPRANLTYKCADSTLFEDQIYIAYGSLNKVFIYTAKFNFSQKLQVEGSTEVVGTLAFSENGKLAVGYESMIVIFIPQKNDLKVEWHISEIIQYQNPHCLDWSSNEKGEDILIAGSKLITMWKKKNNIKEIKNESDYVENEFEIIWEQESANEVILVSFSPDKKFFATLTEFDSLIKIWYNKKDENDKNEEKYNFDFLYLSHPRSVISFDWRKQVKRKNGKHGKNVLLTMCRDNICRLWAQCSDENNNQKFYMCKMIEPTRLPPSLNYFPVPESTTSLVHWIDNREINTAIYSKTTLEHNKFKKKWDLLKDNISNSKELKDIIKENPDMLFHVLPDGSVVIWGVQNLNTYPLRIPHLVVLIKIPKAFSPSDYDFFRNPVIIYSNPLAQETNALCSSPEIMVVAHNSKGIMNCYEMNLNNIFISTQETHFRMVYSWAANQNSINELICHPNLPYIATSDNKSEIMIWYNDGILNKKDLDWVTSINIFDEKIKYGWFTEGPYLYVYQNNKIYIFIITDRVIQNVLTLNEMENDYPIIFINSFTKNKYSYLYALSSKEKTLFIWKIQLKENDYKIKLIYKASIGIETYGEITNVISLSDFSAAFTNTNIPIGLFATYTQDKHLIYWHISNEKILLKSDDEVITNNLMVKSIEKRIDENIVMMKNSQLNTLAIVIEKDEKYYLDIYINDIYSLVLKKQYSIELKSKVFDMDWYFTSEGQQFLAVGIQNKVQIYCRTKWDEDNINIVKWDVFSEIPLENGYTNKLISWLENGTLVYANDSVIFCLDRWIIPQNKNILSSPKSNIFLSAKEITHRLPLYHPQHLTNYILWGHYGIAKTGLNVLYQYISMMRKANKEIKEIPSPLWSIFDNEDEKGNNQKSQYNFLFSNSNESTGNEDVFTFTNEKARLLTEYLYQIKLPYINKHEQMNLVGIVNILLWATEQKMSLDENGMRYLIAMKLFTYARRNISSNSQLNFRDITWAFYSESQEILLNFCSSSCGEKLLWKDARALGISLWIKNNNTLRRQIEIIARNQYMNNGENNPYNCSIFYLAMRKLKVLIGLWKTAIWHPEQDKMLRFLLNDFTEKRWQKAALKNAYALLSKRRFEHSVMFFLLGDHLRDAVNVCLKQLKDVHLAITICRLYEGDDSVVLREIYTSYLLPLAISTNDRWLANHVFSFLKDKENTLLSIFAPLENLRTHVGEMAYSYSDLPGLEYFQEIQFEDPTLLILFQNLKDKYKILRIPIDIKPSQEKKLIFKAINSYEIMGCPMLSLDLINKYSSVLLYRENNEIEKNVKTSFVPEIKNPVNELEALNTGLIDWSDVNKKKTTTINNSAADYDWSQPETKLSSSLNWDEYEKEKVKTDNYVTIDDNMKIGEESEILNESDDKKDDSNSAISKNSHVYINQSITLLKWYLGLRAIWDGCNSITNVLENEYILVENQLFKQFIKKMHNGFKKLSKSINMPIEIINCVLIWGCNQDHSTLAFIDIFPINGKSIDFQDVIDSIFNEKSNTLSSLLFRLSDGDDSFPGSDSNYKYIQKISKRFLITLDHWIKQLHKANIKKYSSKMFQFAHSIYISLILTNLHLKNWKKITSLIYNMKSFFRSLQNEDSKALHVIIKEIITHAEIQITEDEESMDDDEIYTDEEEEKIKTNNKNENNSECSEIILNIVTYYYMLSILEDYLNELENIKSDEVTNQFFEYLLKPLSNMTYIYEKNIKEKDKEYIANKENINKLFNGNKEQKRYWKLLKSLTETDLIIHNILKTTELNNIVNEDDTDKSHELIFKANEPILSFSINPIDNKYIAVATARGIYELDIEISSNYYEQKKSGNIHLPLMRSFDVLNNMEIKKATQNYNEENNSQINSSESQYSLTSSIPSSPKSSLSGKNLSYDSIQRAFKRSLSGNLRNNNTPSDYDYVVTLKRQALNVTCVSSHPTNNYYIAAINDTTYSKSSIALFQYGHPEAIMLYTTNDTSKITKCYFDSYGQRFGASTVSGDLFIWNFENAQSSSEPYQVINCHSTINDFMFLASSSLIATAGVSSNNNSVCLYDTLLPQTLSRVKVFSIIEESALSLSYSPQNKLLMAGTKRGDIYVFDIKNVQCLNTFQAHSLSIKAMEIDEGNDCLISSSIEGDIKVWSFKNFEKIKSWARVHAKQQLIRNHSEKSMSTIGVNKLLIQDEYVYSCGSDGTLRRTHWS